MSDYVRSRPAKVGEKLRTHHFHPGFNGVCCTRKYRYGRRRRLRQPSRCPTDGSGRRNGGGTRDRGSAEGTPARAASLVAAMLPVTATKAVLLSGTIRDTPSGRTQAGRSVSELLFLWIVGLMYGGRSVPQFEGRQLGRSP
jgi:hypothetical protein